MKSVYILIATLLSLSAFGETKLGIKMTRTTKMAFDVVSSTEFKVKKETVKTDVYQKVSKDGESYESNLPMEWGNEFTGLRLIILSDSQVKISGQLFMEGQPAGPQMDNVLFAEVSRGDNGDSIAIKFPEEPAGNKKGEIYNFIKELVKHEFDLNKFQKQDNYKSTARSCVREAMELICTTIETYQLKAKSN
ncbi:MAG: hypothetical protein EP326_07670 [Deltaproteobacteria bacterium]|nr:MAG: hypothetical protein EP326_07670 [Deltaproteobacteria bacterium]